MGAAKTVMGMTLGFALASCAGSAFEQRLSQPVIDLHRHAPWPGDSDTEGLAVIRGKLRAHRVVAAALFITGREDLERYRSDSKSRFLLSPMFPCPALTAERKWCFTENQNLLPEAVWIDHNLASGSLGGIGELVFNYAGIAPGDPAMLRYWRLAAKHDAIAFVHSGRGPDKGLGPRRHKGCCPSYNADYGNPALLRPVLKRFPKLRVVLGHVGFDYLEETTALMRDFPNIYADMSVLNSVGPRKLHDASLRKLVAAGLASRIVLGSDDQDYAPIIERIEGASFLTQAQRRGIYYDNAARLLRLDRSTIATDYGR